MRLVIISGMPGAGKSELANAFAQEDIPVIVMGDIIREEAKSRGLNPSPQNTKMIMLELREKKGMGAVALHCLPTLEIIESQVVVIEGCRSIEEIDVFEDYADEVTIISVHSSPQTRYNRLRERGRHDAPIDWESFRERDLRELSVGLGGVIALSHQIIINEESLETLRERAGQVVRKYL